MSTTTVGSETAISILARARTSLNFGTAGDVENLISKAQINYLTRQSRLPLLQSSVDFLLEPQDFDLNYDRASRGSSRITQLLKDIIGGEAIISTQNDRSAKTRTGKVSSDRRGVSS